MIDLTSIFRGVEILSKFLGLNSIAAFWYLTLACVVIYVLFNSLHKVKESHIGIYGELKEISVSLADLKGDFKELASHQTMQEKYVKEQERRYTDNERALRGAHEDTARIKAKLDI